MSAFLSFVSTRTPRLALAAALASLALSGSARAQSAPPFAVGVAGSIVNDSGTANNASGFDDTAGHAFGEMTFERWGVLQARYTHLTLPGTQPDSPKIRVDAAALSVGYLFREEWWRAGAYLGAAYFHLAPRDPGEGQTAVDAKEDVFGWTGGLLTIFDVASHWDARLEVSGFLIRSQVEHKPILVTAGVAYRF